MMFELATVISAFQEVLSHKGETNVPIHAGSALAELGFDSLDFAEVLVVLEEQIGSELTVDGLIAGATVRDFHDMLAIDSDYVL